MKKTFVILICFLTSSAVCNVDDKTSPFAYTVASQFSLANAKQKFQCPFSNQNSNCNPLLTVRSFDGTCNNLQQPLLGSTQTPHKRLLSPAYDDGISSPRVRSISGNMLPNPRGLSLNLSTDSFNTQEQIWTHLWVTFGQFITHDIAATALSNCKFKCFLLNILFLFSRDRYVPFRTFLIILRLEKT